MPKIEVNVPNIEDWLDFLTSLVKIINITYLPVTQNLLSADPHELCPSSLDVTLFPHKFCRWPHTLLYPHGHTPLPTYLFLPHTLMQAVIFFTSKPTPNFFTITSPVIAFAFESFIYTYKIINRIGHSVRPGVRFKMPYESLPGFTNGLNRSYELYDYNFYFLYLSYHHWY